MIVTVTLNPAIDQTIFVEGLQLGAVNRGTAQLLNAGGKGVNVAAVLADYGLPVAVTGLLGSDNPAPFEQLFARNGMRDHFVRIPGATRSAIKLIDRHAGLTTEINLPGLAPSPAALEELEQRLETLSVASHWCVLSGNLPPGVPDDWYARIIARLRARGCRVALDTSQAALAAGVRAAPTLVKPNLDELRHLTGAALSELPEIVAAGRALLRHGIELVAISLGADGALLIDRQQCLIARPPRVEVVSPVGAGDALLAGLIAGQVTGLDLAARARLATAFALGVITRVGAQLPDRATLHAYQCQVSVAALEDC
ncbi:1-phosphofructokinase [Kallotenue papyrolyticum]|uniref:1-phosphofructokinase n=1 Tax=Kallotenue papyrolyticum TaxID=1325125 RepID=UPI00049276E1|nr:1-phosphofructokinase [Kallotenue papyrolyticum]